MKKLLLGLVLFGSLSTYAATSVCIIQDGGRENTHIACDGEFVRYNHRDSTNQAKTMSKFLKEKLSQGYEISGPSTSSRIFLIKKD